jgi:hypothetical protein
MSPTSTPSRPARSYGWGRVLISVYAILAIGATSRAVFQILTAFHTAPIAISLSAVSGVIYVLATVALILPGRAWYRVAWTTISFELAGVLIIGTLSLVAPEVFAERSTVWSEYGIGYVFIPLILPIVGMIYLRRRRTEFAEA